MRATVAALLFAGASLLAPGCTSKPAPAGEPEPVLQVAPQGAPKPTNDDKPKRVDVGKNVHFEKAGDQRRVIVDAYVCLREGQLEQLLTRKQGKEHESILAADVDARHIHAALLLAGAKAGSTVTFEP